MTREALQQHGEYVAEELRHYRRERDRLEAEQRDLEAELVRVKSDRKELEESLSASLVDGRAVLGVTKMAQLAGVSRNKAHRLLREEQEWADGWDPDPETGLTFAVALELACLLDNPQALREAWVELGRYGPTATAAQAREVVRRRFG